MERVLVVAFDGMDSDLVTAWNLSAVQQQEFGPIDNHTGITEIKTGELFASFITGETSETHGVTGVKGWNNPVLETAERMVPRREPFYSAAARVKDVITGATGMERETFSREDLEADTLFDKIPDSHALNVPAYSANPSIETWSWVLDRYGVEAAAREAEKEFRQRRAEFEDEIADHQRTFLMAHFHYLDSMNHLFGDDIDDEARLRAAYEAVDTFAEDILSMVDGLYDTVIFMSDHGLPTATAHNTNAFYSCNKPLFPETTPHITAFHDQIMEKTGAADVAGIDI